MPANVMESVQIPLAIKTKEEREPSFRVLKVVADLGQSRTLRDKQPFLRKYSS
jgi:hypothetical protein